MPERNFTLSLIIGAKDTASAALKGFSSGLADRLAIPKTVGAAFEKLGSSIGGLVTQIPAMVAEMVKMGAEVGDARVRYEELAGGSTKAALMIDAVRKAAEGSVTSLEAMQASELLLTKGVANTASEMEQMTKIAYQLGDQSMTLEGRINGVVTAMERQTIPKSFGVSLEAVKERAAELTKTMDGLTKDKAFEMAFLEIAGKRADDFAKTADSTSDKMARMSAGFKELKLSIGETWSKVLGDTGALDVINTALDTGRKYTIAYGEAMVKYYTSGLFKKGWSGAFEALSEYNLSLKLQDALVEASNLTIDDATERYQQYVKGTDKATESLSYLSAEQIEAGKVREHLAEIDAKLAAENEEYNKKKANSDHGLAELIINTQRDVEAGAKEKARILIGSDQDIAKKILAANEEIIKSERDKTSEVIRLAEEYAKNKKAYLLDEAMNYTSYFRDVKEQETEAATKREELEAEHQKKLTALRAGGQAKAKEIDRQAEEEKLALLQSKLSLALQQQSEFTDKTKESTRMAKDMQIASLQEQIAEEQALLSGANTVKTTDNATKNATLIAQEQTRYAEELALLQTEMDKQKEEQRLKLGEMVLESFMAWAQMKQIPADKMVEMRTAIAVEYGLMDENAAITTAAMTVSWENWADGFDTSASKVVSDVDTIIGRTESMKAVIDSIQNKEIWIKVNTEYTGGLPTGSLPSDVLAAMNQANNPGPAANAPTTPAWNPTPAPTTPKPKQTPTFSELQGGTPFWSGGWAKIGEAGPEMVNLPRGSEVRPSTVNNYFNQTVNTRATQPSVIQDFNIMRSMIG